MLRPFTARDMPLLRKWLYTLHVAKWYPEPKDWLEEAEKQDTEYSWIHHFIAEVDVTPIGFCQYYDCFNNKNYECWEFSGEPNAKYSIDYLIGETEYLQKGYGTAIINALIRKIIHEGGKLIAVQPEPLNIPSNKVLQKCGFKFNGECYEKDC